MTTSVPLAPAGTEAASGTGPVPTRPGRWRRPAVGAAIALGLLAGLGPADAVDHAVRSLPLGSVFALMAVGVVLTYRTAGVLNLGFAAQAFTSATVFYELRVRRDWPTGLAVLVAVAVVAPLLGLALDRLLFRHLRTAPPAAGLVTGLGVLVALPELTLIWSGDGSTFDPPSIFPGPATVHRWGEWALDGHQLGTIVVTGLVVGGLLVALRATPAGLWFRAVVESPRLAQLHGVDADRVGAAAWVLSSTVAGLAGVLLAPLYSQVQRNDFFTLLVAALAAAAFAGLRSLGGALAGSLLLAFAMHVLGTELPQGNLLTENLRPALPFVALILLLLARPRVTGDDRVDDPLRAVDPPPLRPRAAARPDRPRRLRRWAAGPSPTVVVPLVTGTVAAGAVVSGALDDYWTGRLTVAVLMGICFLSVTVLWGLGGWVALCPATFAAIGAFTTARVVHDLHIDVLSAVAAGAALAAVVGALVALPALRVRGVALALVTLAFAVAFETVAVPHDVVSGGTTTLRVPRPTIGPLDFADDGAFFLLCTAGLAAVGWAVQRIRQGTTGRSFDARRASEPAAAAIGIDARRLTVTAFATSAAIAGFGGGLLATQSGISGQAHHQANFTPFLGLVWVVVVVTLGARSITAAVVGGVSVVVLPELLDEVGLDQRWAVVLFGLGALTYARHPAGILDALRWQVHRQRDVAVQRRAR